MTLAAGFGHVETIRVLLNNKAYIEGRGMYEMTPLGWAAWKGNTDCAELLLKHGANIHAT